MNNKKIYTLETRDEFKKFTKSYKTVIVKFTASWCGPCKRITPLVNDLFSKMPQNVYMLIIDIDKAKDIASYLKVRSVPMLCNYISNEPMDSVVGANEEKVINFFKKRQYMLFRDKKIIILFIFLYE